MIDLHTHSILSDGSSEPEEIAELAKASGCSVLSLTDHDRLDGITRARCRAQQLGIDLIAGCEVSCEFKDGSCHILVYFVEPGESALQDELDRLLYDRENRNSKLIDRLNQIGVQISIEEVRAQAGEGSIGRPHFAQVLVDKGMAESIQMAFDRFLAKGAPAYISKARITPGEVAKLARQSGGVAVLAHPFTLGMSLDELHLALVELKELGIVGIEAYYGKYSIEQRSALVDLAQRLDLVATGGSDFHGSYKPGLAVGTGAGDLEVPESVIHELENRRP